MTSASGESKDPTLDYEAELAGGGTRFVIGCDEVGRGALAGPLAVGMAVIEATAQAFPKGLRDSKLLSAARRQALEPACKQWVLHWSVGQTSADEIDELGIMTCLGLAAKRAFDALALESLSDCVLLLDGNIDYLKGVLPAELAIATRVHADRQCASVAAASVIAKVARDRQMVDAAKRHPGYGWESNKGYGSAAHREAIAQLGPTPLHRVSWLPSPTLYESST